MKRINDIYLDAAMAVGVLLFVLLLAGPLFACERGTTWTDACNTCTCLGGDISSCTTITCGVGTQAPACDPTSTRPDLVCLDDGNGVREWRTLDMPLWRWCAPGVAVQGACPSEPVIKEPPELCKALFFRFEMCQPEQKAP